MLHCLNSRNGCRSSWTGDYRPLVTYIIHIFHIFGTFEGTHIWLMSFSNLWLPACHYWLPLFGINLLINFKVWFHHCASRIYDKRIWIVHWQYVFSLIMPADQFFVIFRFLFNSSTSLRLSSAVFVDYLQSHNFCTW